MKSANRSAVVAVIVALVGACGDDAVTGPVSALQIHVPHGAVQAVVQRLPAAADGSITFVVRVVANTVTVSSYEGAVTFAPGSFELVSVATPPPGDGVTYVLNAEPFTNGQIRFAALTTARFDDANTGVGAEALRFTVRALRPASQANLSATLDVVGTATGAALEAHRIFASSGAPNATGVAATRQPTVRQSVAKQRASDCASSSMPWGDVNVDGATNIIDAQQIAAFSVGLPVARLAAMQFAGDVTADGDVNIIDAQQIAASSVGLAAAARIGTLLAIPNLPASVTVAPSTATIQVGAAVPLTAVAVDVLGNAMGACASLSWSSDNLAVATVTASGQVSGIAVGTAHVTATSDGQNGSALVLVSAFPSNLVFTSVTTGAMHTCGLAVGGTAYCWGDNEFGQLGDSTKTNSSTPVRVRGGLTFAALAAGGVHTCGLTTAGAVFCWGDNTYSQLGNGVPGPGCFAIWTCGVVTQTSPVPVTGGRTYASLASGAEHTCALTAGGTAYCWGFGFYGQLGFDHSSTTSCIPAGVEADFNCPDPTPVAGGLSFRAVTAGSNHTCGLVANGMLYCWGDDGGGQLGVGTTAGPQLCPAFDSLDFDPGPCSMAPALVASGLSFTSVSAGSGETCAATQAGAAYCWGGDQLLFGVDSIPTPVAGGISFASIGVGCGISFAHTAYCWGFGTSSATPVAVGAGLSFASLSVSVFGYLPQELVAPHTCGVTTGGVVYCWGDNSAGQLGNGTTTNSAVPVKVANQQ